MADKYLNKDNIEVEAVVVSAGEASSGKIVALDSTGKFDESLMPAGIGPFSLTFPASEDINIAHPLINIWNDSGTLRVRNANATGATKPCHGFVKANVSSLATATVYFPNNIVGGFVELTPGSNYYLSADTNGGAIIESAAFAYSSGKIIQFIGFAISTTQIYFVAIPQFRLTAPADV